MPGEAGHPAHPARVEAAAVALLAFGSGFGILVLEIAGGRVLAEVYGLSTVPWTGVIATVLAGLALGNGVGGWLADRGRGSLFLLFLLAGGSVAVPVLGAGLPGRLLAAAGFLGGALLSAAAFLLLPAVLMGAVTPMLVKRATVSVGEVGLRFGDVGAWSTTGAIAGTLSGGFLLLPAFPLPLVLGFVGLCFLLLAATAASLDAVRPGPRPWATLALAPLPLLLVLVPRGEEGLVFRGQSVHSEIRVVDREWYPGATVRELWQNGSRSSAERRASGEPAHLYQIALAWLLDERLPESEGVLVLGGAANTLPAFLKRRHPHLSVTVVELDPRVVDVARAFFAWGAMPEASLDVRVTDARPFLRRDDGRYDVIVADAYDHLYSIPWPLLTVEALTDMRARLREGGIVTVTLSTPLVGEAGRLARRIVATVREVFPHVRVYLSREGVDPSFTQEVVLVAARSEEELPTIPWPRTSVEAEGAPFRDDFAPVEYLTALRLIHDPAWRPQGDRSR